MKTDWVQQARPDLKRAGIAMLVAIAGMVTASFGDLKGPEVTATDRVLAIGGALVLLVAGVIAVRALARAVRKASTNNLGDARGVAMGWVIMVVGYFVLILALLGVLDVPLGGLLFGGAITGIVIGIAAQQTLANFFAGIVLMIARPLQIGEHVVLRSGPLGGEYEGTVTDMTLFYVSMNAVNGPVVLPNAGVLASAIGPGARTPKDEEPTDEDGQPLDGGGPSDGRSDNPPNRRARPA
ncbi:MAG: mechanosensitive ion channel family protein [Actinomycetota bacterium]|nr:mechanosensitive ion channel family protein [Actinomycetota bacterium]